MDLSIHLKVKHKDIFEVMLALFVFSNNGCTQGN